MTINSSPKLSIIIVSYNSKDRLKACLSSVYKEEKQLPLEIIISDNNSVDGSVEMLRSNFPQATVIENKKNLGFSKGVNIGLENSLGEYKLLLNPDTIILKNSLKNMVDFMDSTPQSGISGSKLLNADGTIQATGRNFPKPINAIFGRTTYLTSLFKKNRFSKDYMPCLNVTNDEPLEVDWVSGASLMIRKKTLDEVGRLDEDFFMYWEDAEFCHRVKKNGWKVFYLPNAIISHDEGHGGSNTTKPVSAKLIFSFHKSAYLYYKKHYITSRLHPMNFIAMGGLTSIGIYKYFSGYCKRVLAFRD